MKLEEDNILALKMIILDSRKNINITIQTHNILYFIWENLNFYQIVYRKNIKKISFISYEMYAKLYAN